MEDQFLILKREDLETLLTEILKDSISKEPDRFISEAEALRLLNCGKTTLYQLRVSGEIAYVQNESRRKMILYDRTSIMDYLESNLKKAY